ncbi:hypothetical protein MLD52_11540 [Puniceicoccaceae bacterium K14]|nr:hypothetical protein [Puniceicoccaceae bacterium K14]
MIIVKNSYSDEVFFECFKRLNEKGSTRILLHGEELAERFYKRLKDDISPSVVVAHTSLNEEYRDSVVECQDPDAAYGEVWDAVFVFNESDTQDVVGRCEAYETFPHIVLIGKRAENPILVSLAKSGSHLVTRVLKELGYDIIGPGGRMPKRKEILSFVRHGSRLGMNLRKSVGFDAVNMSIVPNAFSRALQLVVRGLIGKKSFKAPFLGDIASIPNDICLCLHTFVLDRIDNPFFQTWSRKGEPKIIYSFRDPRAIVSSYVRYLMRGYGGIGKYPDQYAHSAILRAMDNNHDRIMHAITDTTFPYHNSLRECTWLLLHPQVLNLRYEDLVGENGGGDERRQGMEIVRLMTHLNVGGDPAEIARVAYNKDTETFAKGKIDTWKSEFNEKHIEAINQRIGDLIALYGYDVNATLHSPKDEALELVGIEN